MFYDDLIKSKLFKDMVGKSKNWVLDPITLSSEGEILTSEVRVYKDMASAQLDDGITGRLKTNG